jgi:hypothetical protein
MTWDEARKAAGRLRRQRPKFGGVFEAMSDGEVRNLRGCAVLVRWPSGSTDILKRPSEVKAWLLRVK